MGELSEGFFAGGAAGRVATHGPGDDQFRRMDRIVSWPPQTTAGSSGASR
jgi:hypothetical protein